MRKAGVRLTIVSNGAEKRVRPFAQKLGLAYLYRSAKPLPFALMAQDRGQVQGVLHPVHLLHGAGGRGRGHGPGLRPGEQGVRSALMQPLSPVLQTAMIQTPF